MASESPQALATPPWADTTEFPSQLLQSYHQDCHRPPDVPRANCALYLSVHGTTSTRMTWLWRTYPSTFLANLRRRGNTLRNWWWCGTKDVVTSFCRIIKKPEHDYTPKSRLNVMDCSLCLEKSVSQSLSKLHRLATDQTTTTCVTSLRITTCTNRWNPPKNWATI